MPGGMDLKNEVLVNSTCALCGACLDWCPYIANLEDHLVLRFDCNVADGRCYSVCPRTFTDWQAVRAKYLPDVPENYEIGPYLEVCRTKAAHPVDGQQDGGTVSRLLQTLLEDQTVTAVLLTGSDDHLTPQPFLSGAADAVAQAAGSRFLASPGLRKIIEAEKNGVGQLAVVGRPCQIQVLRKLDFNRPDAKPPLEILAIGLFCMWSLDWRFKDYLRSQFPGEEITGIAIPQHGVEVATDRGVHSLPAQEVKQFIKPGCGYCMDMTAELADLSVGAFEPEKGWNTVLVRTRKGQELLQRALEQGKLERADYPTGELQRLQGAALGKKQRGLEAARTAFAGGVKPFIDLENKWSQQVKNLAEGAVK
ncbi:MAG TPA: Coenzyme F420 hydrogenase/dehydrogenase, beta subunit C-terminal domain [Syntrophomonas sp.]|nr:Coenzyme F420 hydrogenase/dehydrogenase, beta subunit C-terminal domain [Syntrophomonas sp.]